jgi:Beta-ketoacyl synthase, N-terminal domain
MSTPAHSALTVYLDAVGVFAPSMPNWLLAQSYLSQAQPPALEPLAVPAPTVLPPAERRRVGTAVKLALAAGIDALQPDSGLLDGSQFQTVFTSSGGDGDNCHNLCEALAEPVRAVSPTRFTNSVHNAPSGYWGIALKAKPASTSICAFDGSFGAGFLDAITQVHTQHTPVLLVSYDTPYPSPLAQTRHVQDHCAVALLLSPQASHRSLARLDVSLSQAPASVMHTPALEQLRLNNPSARVLPLLSSLAQQRSQTVVIDYLQALNLSLAIELMAHD